MSKRTLTWLVLALAGTLSIVSAQRREFSNQVRNLITVDAPVVALTHVRVIDGTGAPAKADQTTRRPSST